MTSPTNGIRIPSSLCLCTECAHELATANSERIARIHSKRLPVVLTRDEVDRVPAELRDPYRLIAQLLYGAGLRLLEGLSLRVQDLDFQRHEILVRHGKGGKDRRTMLPQTLTQPLQTHLEGVRESHQRELARGKGQVRCRRLSSARFLRRSRIGAGNGCFRRIQYRSIREMAGVAGTICTKARCRAKSLRQAGGRS